MIYEKIIKINGWEVVSNLCTVSFNIRVYFTRKSGAGAHVETELTGQHAGQATHSIVYQLIETADKVEANSPHCVEVYHSNIKTEIFLREQ